MEDSRLLRLLKITLNIIFAITAIAAILRPELLRVGVGVLIPVTAALIFLGWLTNDPWGDP
jgi:hypothetical protein